jgi:hypothetical protein
MKLATTSQSVAGDSMARIALPSSAGACGSSCTGLDGALTQGEPARLDLLTDRRRLLVRLDARHQKRLAAHIVEDCEALLALRDQVMGPVGRGHEAHDGGDRPDSVKMLGLRALALRRL